MIAQFAAALRETEARKAAERERRQAERTKAEELDVARAELERAIGAVRRAQRSRSGIAEADAAWRAAKARVLELETGARPEWAPPPEDEGAQPDEAHQAEADEHTDEAPHDDADDADDETTA